MERIRFGGVHGHVGRDGFTLIELLIVVAIIGILSGIAIPNFINAQIKAKVAKVQSEQRSLSLAIQSAGMDIGTFVPMGRPASGDCGDMSDPRRHIRADGEVGWYTPFTNAGHSTFPPRCQSANGDPIRNTTGVGWTDMRYLTSPLAYISSFPLDPFNAAGPKDEVSQYWYGGCDLRTKFTIMACGPGTTTNPFERRHSETCFDAWGNAYDPTNGIKSAGAIWRTGP